MQQYYNIERTAEPKLTEEQRAKVRGRIILSAALYASGLFFLFISYYLHSKVLQTFTCILFVAFSLTSIILFGLVWKDKIEMTYFKNPVIKRTSPMIVSKRFEIERKHVNAMRLDMIWGICITTFALIIFIVSAYILSSRMIK